MKKYTREMVRRCKRRIDYRLRDRTWKPQEKPMLSASNIQYEMGDRLRGTAVGGIGMMHLLARRTGLIEAIDEKVEVLKRHLPYHESDHVLNIAYNALNGGTCFGKADIEQLMDSFNETRLKVWQQQGDDFFEQAIVDADGTLAETLGECKQGMDITYKGEWGYHPLLISLANTQEPLFLENRSGSRPSHEGAAARLDQAIQLCARAGFRRMLLRGDTDFSQTRYLDGWNEKGVEFIFGIDAMATLVSLADALGPQDWTRLERPAKYEVATSERTRPENVKEQIVRDRGFNNIRLKGEDVAEFLYRPGACKQEYRIIALRKNLSVERGEQALFDDIRYFFYITNRMDPEAEIVLLANQRCNQENLIAQLKSGVQAMSMPVDDQTSNWAYMVMASLAWTLKAWFALLLPETGRWADKYAEEKQAVLGMEFKTFLNAFIRLPCQVIRSGRQIVFRIMAWNPWLPVFLRGVDVFHQPLRC